MDLWEIERSCFERGYTLVCGADGIKIVAGKN